MKKVTSSQKQGSPSQDHSNTSEAAQVARVLAALMGGPRTTLELRHNFNVLHPAGRVRTLRQRGHKIVTERVLAIDAEGNQHQGIARYVLIECGNECL